MRFNHATSLNLYSGNLWFLVPSQFDSDQVISEYFANIPEEKTSFVLNDMNQIISALPFHQMIELFSMLPLQITSITLSNMNFTKLSSTEITALLQSLPSMLNFLKLINNQLHATLTLENKEILLKYLPSTLEYFSIDDDLIL